MYTYTGCMTCVIIHVHVSVHTVEESMLEPATCIRKSFPVLSLNKTKASPSAFLSHKTHFHVSQCVLLPLCTYTALTILDTYTYMYTAHTHTHTHVHVHVQYCTYICHTLWMLLYILVCLGYSTEAYTLAYWSHFPLP